MAEDISKLPKWARYEIERLRSDLATAQKKIAEMTPGSGADTDVFILSGIDLIPLPRRTQIRFMLRDGAVDCGMNSNHPDQVHVYVNTRNFNEAVIRPRAANALTLGFAEEPKR
jgi:hypothetical protein